MTSGDAPDNACLLPYVEEPSGTSNHGGVLRPAAPVRLGNGDQGAGPRFLALIDSGSERTLAGPGLGRLALAEPDPNSEMRIQIGGSTRTVRFAQTDIRIYRSFQDSPEEEPLAQWTTTVGYFTSWEPPWAVLLGQRGFFDHFTVTMNRFAQAVAIEPLETFDSRFGCLYDSPVEVPLPRAPW